MTVHFWFSLAVILVFSVPLLAIEGQVVREDGTPVNDATVSIIGYPGTVTTDSRGRFVWAPDPSVPFEVLVILANGQYMAPRLIEELPGEGILRIEVRPVVSDEVVVTSDVTPHIEAPRASAMSLVQGRELRVASPARLTDAIESIPGVSRVSEGHAVVPAIRGLAGGRTLVLIDGGRVSTERRAGPSATYLDPFFLDAIEVARGPGSVAYGSDAFGGIVHARTRTPDPEDPWGLRFMGRLAAGLPERAMGLELNRGFGSGGVLLQGSFRQFDDFHSPLGEIDNSGARNRSFLSRFLHKVGAGTLQVGYQVDQGRDVGRPRNNSDETRFFYPREDSHRFTAAYQADPRWGFSQIKFDFFLGSYRLATTRDGLPEENTPRSVTTSDVTAKDFGVRGLFVKPLRKARFELGVDFNGRFDLNAVEISESFNLADQQVGRTRETAIADARRNDGAVYASTEVQIIEEITLSGGVRFDRVSTRNTGGRTAAQTTSDNAVSGFGSLTVKPHRRIEVTGQFSRGFRDPTLSDRYFVGLSGRGFITGNPALEPEASKQFDLAFRYVSGPVRWRVFFYDYRISDLIERFESGEDLFFFRNRGRAEIRGVEVQMEWLLRPTWTLLTGAELSRGEAVEDDEPLDNIPVQNLKLTLRKSLLEKGYVQGHMAFHDRDTRPGPTERIVPGHAIVDLAAGWTFDSNLELRFQVGNLLDKDYLINPDSRAILASGRNASLMLTVGF